MTSENDVLLALINDKSKVRVLVGTFVSATAAGFVVDVGGGRIPALPATSYLPEINETVWVWFVERGTDSLVLVTGPTTSKPGKGTVVSVSAGLVTLSTAFGNIVVPYDSSVTPTAGQIMKIVWQGGGFAVGVMSIDPTAATAPGAPGSGMTTHVDTFTALDSGSFQSGRWWTGEVYASDNNLSAWFYGTKISDTIPSSATNMSIQTYISAKQIQGSAPNFGLHAYASKPGFSPTIGSLSAVPIAPGWVSLPAAFAAALKSGGGAYGIGVAHGGYNILHSLAEDGASGALRITSTY